MFCIHHKNIIDVFLLIKSLYNIYYSIDLYNWKHVKVWYCDEKSFTGDVETVNLVGDI